jgi:hypothetical protein
MLRRLRKHHLTRATAITGVLASAAVLALPVSAVAKNHPRALSPQQTTYLNEATQGAGQVQAWWNKKLGWYNELLNDTAHYPLASIWDTVPLFEALDEIAAASPTSSHIAAVESFANSAVKYWNPDLKPEAGFAPYPGDKASDQETFFDDNGWWGLGFLDAYQVTHTKAYVYQAENAFHFVQTQGWDSKIGGIWWVTTHASDCGGNCGQDGEAIAADSYLAARLYQLTNDPYYLTWAETFIQWADGNLLNHPLSDRGYYILPSPNNGPSDPDRMPADGNGEMVAAMTTLCEADPLDTFWCDEAQTLAGNLIYWYSQLPPSSPYGDVNDGPQYDTILMRGMLTLYNYEYAKGISGASRLYNFVTSNAARITANPLNSGRYPDAWNGSASIPGWPSSTTGQLQTQAANVSVFAALADATP